MRGEEDKVGSEYEGGEESSSDEEEEQQRAKRKAARSHSGSKEKVNDVSAKCRWFRVPFQTACQYVYSIAVHMQSIFQHVSNPKPS